jgi:3-deoxy-manno-octulosonate cytidylyltransferase (CMP-KDO synthetase)
MHVCGVIPARLQSTRLPRKMLLRETGMTLIEHTWRQAKLSTALDRIIIATDSQEIAAAAISFGAEVAMTGEENSGTERIASAIKERQISSEIIVNIQGDEPEIDPVHINLVVELLQKNPQAEMSTLARTLKSIEELHSPACVKVVLTADQRALYFSRSPIPYYRDGDPQEFLDAHPPVMHPWLVHLGIYCYRRDFLLTIPKLPVSTLEHFEKLEQLRVLQAGAQIQVGIVSRSSFGIDTPADYAAFVKRFQSNIQT